MSANAAIIQPQKISGALLTALNLKSIVVFVASIPRIEKHGDIQGVDSNNSYRGYRPVARTARAPDSKSGGWGFKSLLACLSSKRLSSQGIVINGIKLCCKSCMKKLY